MALMLGGGGLMAVNVYASATDGGRSGDEGSDRPRVLGAATIDCPDVGAQLTTVPDQARAEVDNELAALDQQIADAYRQLQDPARNAQPDSGIMDPLKEDRAATIERIAAAIERVGDRPQGLDALAACTLREPENQTGEQNGGEEQQGDGQDQGDSQDQGDGQNQDGGAQQGNGGQAGNGPVAADFADITGVQPGAAAPNPQADASRGTFVTSCGVNEDGLFNSDNVIVAPGVSNGAHHFHDYVGNQANDAFAGDDDLANGDTSCEDQGDKSSYYWPVLRLQNGTQEQDAGAPGGGTEGNAGEIVTPRQVTLTFVGSPRGEVTAMPRLLRIITGDAKAFVNGTANANASWSCTGFEDRQLKDKYPLCPQGSDVVRTFRFQSCWDGSNIDSANHRTHVAFAQADGVCPAGFQAIPQLVQRIVYDVDAPSLQDGGRTTPLFAVDSFPEQLHKPVTDHGDFINVFDEDLMQEMVDCINEGRQCGPGADQDPGNGEDPQDQPTDDPQDEPTEQPSEQPSDEPEEQPTATPAPSTGGNSDNGGNGGNGEQGENGQAKPDASPTAPAAEDAPKVYGTPTPAKSASTTLPEAWSNDLVEDEADSTASAIPTTGAAAQPPAGAQTEPQTAGGSLAETGTQLWPAAAGAVLLISGFVLLRRTRRGSL
ncbi:membrane protein [Streptomyces sp. MMG1533]|uniref:DUF1996 domain-containing protein n=1 Tax=Streptomyces sp. MMG1533 TaxID=1415546 RepID=UPI0006B04338|nr:DUF1996 domain-containing protein [Streptomyces sp. MMG1533]KOU75990.1 membrane protein [Streptomyces sp. MMG1533]